jgi:hypothetical protein
LGQDIAAPLTTRNQTKGENHAYSAVAAGNTDSADHPDHAVAPLIAAWAGNNNHLPTSDWRLK